MNKLINSMIAVGMACCIFATGQSTTYADILYDKYQVGTNTSNVIDYGSSNLSENMIKATQLMEELLQNSYDNSTKAIEEQIETCGYDYELTMENVNEKGNPYTNADMKKLIAVSCTVLSLSDRQLTEIPFLTVKYSDRYITGYQPYKYATYEKQNDGTYIESGTAYLTTPGYIPTFQKSHGAYKKTGNVWKDLDKVKIKYADVTFKITDIQVILSKMGIEQNSGMEDFNHRMSVINKDMSQDLDKLCQTIFIKTRSTVEPLSDEYTKYIKSILESTEGNRQIVLATAAALLGKIPYEWGGKSTKAGYDDSWWSIRESNGKQKGLDCSGYVQWVFRTAGYDESVWKPIGSTSAILTNAQPISEEELQPGDLGLLHTGGKGTNHVGIYLGDGYYIHCSSSAGTVTISKPKFTVFRRVKGIDEGNPVPTEVKCGGDLKYTEDDVTLLAKLIAHEVRGEGLNSWIAVGEVVVNRVRSTQFPSTLHDVIYQESKSGVKQFSYNEGIAAMEPSADIIRTARGVLDGSLHVLNNSKVLYFRNPGDMNNNEDWGPFKFYQRIGPVVYYLGKDW